LNELFIVLLFQTFRERHREIQDEYEEREKRWNRIGSLLDREDLVSNSSSSSVSMTHNVYLNNGIPSSMSTGKLKFFCFHQIVIKRTKKIII